MTIRHFFSALILAILLSGCSSIQISFNATPQATSAGTEEAQAHASATSTPAFTSTPLPTATSTPTTIPSDTPTSTPSPQPTAAFPVLPGTPVPDLGFSTIGMTNVDQLSPVLTVLNTRPWQIAITPDRQKFFVAAANGISVYDQSGSLLARWQNIFTYDIACDTCLSVDADGSRFAVITRNNGAWEARVYGVEGTAASLVQTIPVDGNFLTGTDPAAVALSPDGNFLATSAGNTGHLQVVDLQGHQTVLKYIRHADATYFSPDGSRFFVRIGRELLTWHTSNWKNPTNLILPREDSPLAFSPDGKLLAVALPSRLRIYALDSLQIAREISIQPLTASTRTWELTFLDNQTVRGYGVRWDDKHTIATADTVEWNVATGDTIRQTTSETNSPDAFNALYGFSVPINSPNDIQLGDYRNFGFVSADTLLVDSAHSACWLQLSNGQEQCFSDPDHAVVTSAIGAYKEIPQSTGIVLQSWKGDTLLEVGRYHIAAISHNADYIMVDLNGLSADLYIKGDKLPTVSVAGTFQTFVENNDLLAYSAKQRSGVVSITLFDKNAHKVLWQKISHFFLKPMVMAGDGSLYFLTEDTLQNQFILNLVQPGGSSTQQIVRLNRVAEIESMAYSPTTNLFAFGLQDGTVLIITQEGQQSATFQGAYGPATAVSFTPDGRYLAVASQDGVRVYAVMP